MAQGNETYVIKADIEELKKQLNEAVQRFDNLSKSVQDNSGKMDSAMKKVGAMVGSYFAFSQVQQFASAVVKARSEIQSYQVSFNTLLGSAQKGTKLFNQIKQFAVSTPLLLKDLASASRTMLGFGVSAEQVMPNLKAIGDISMGDSQKFQSLTLAFSQMTATGHLMGQDLLQMINAGFNPLEEISRKTGKSIGELKDEMSKGAISAEMVRDAFMSATSEGGKFNGMLEAQSKTIAGAIRNLQGAYDDMLNDMGTAIEPIVAETISGLTELIKNYEKIGAALAELIALVGVYKAASFAVTIIEQAKALNKLVTAMKAATSAQAAFNVVCNANPYVLLATVLTGVGIAAGHLAIALDDDWDAINKADKKIKESNNTLDKATEKAEKLISKVEAEAKAYNGRSESLQKLEKLYPSIFAKYDTEAKKLAHIRDINKDIIAYEYQKQKISVLKEVQRLDAEIKKREKASETSHSYNPFSAQKITEYKKQKEELLKGLKELKKTASEKIAVASSDSTSTTTSTPDKNAQKDAKERAELEAERRKQAKDAELAHWQAQIDAMDEGAEKYIQQLRLNYEKILAENEQQGQKWARDAFYSKTANKNKPFDVSGYQNYLTDEQKGILNTSNSDALTAYLQGGSQAFFGKYDSQESKTLKGYKTDIESMKAMVTAVNQADITGKDKIIERLQKQIALAQNYLQIEQTRSRLEFNKEYGTGSAKREAISQSYDQLIQQAQAQGDYTQMASFIMKKGQELKAIGQQDTQGTISRAMSVANVNPMFRSGELKGVVAEAIKELKNALNNPDLEATDINSINEAIAKLEGSDLNISLKTLKEKLELAGQEMVTLAGSMDGLKVAENLAFAQLQKVQNNPNASKNDVEVATRNYQRAVSNRQASENRLTAATNSYANLSNSVQQKKGATQQLFDQWKTSTKKDENGNIDWKGLGNAVKSTVDVFSQLNGSIDGLLGSLGVKMDDGTQDVINGTMDIANAGAQAMSGDYVGAAMSAFSGITSLFEGIAALSDNWEEMMDIIDDNTEAVENLGWALGEYEKDFETSDTTNVQESYDKMQRNLEDQEEALQNAMEATSKAYHGCSDSLGSYLDDDYKNVLKKINSYLSTSFSNFTTMFKNLNSEQVYALRTKNPQLYTELQRAISEEEEDHEGGVATGMGDYLDQLSELKSETEEWKQELTDIFADVDFDSFRDNWESMLKDLDSYNKDFAKSIEDTVNNAVVNSVADKYAERLKKAQQKIATAIQNNNTALLEEAKKEYMEITEEAKAEVQAYKEEGVITTSASEVTEGSSQISNGITEDTGSAINGRITAIAVNQERSLTLFESMQSVMFQQNEKMEDIVKNTNRLASIEEHLDKIERNTTQI